jgi:EmrB/QacA subfamily drug resistance transporter
MTATSTTTGTVPDRRRWIGLVIISISVALIIVDSTIVNVAIPSVVKELGINSTQVQWVQESYTLVFAALLLVWGTLADRIGRRRLLIIGLAIFGLSSIGAALAPSGNFLIGARVIQGIGGAMMLPTTLSLINATFRGRERGIAFAVWGSTIGGMAAVGPLLGGWLTTYFSWRWAFGINVPAGIILIIGALVFVSESKSSETRRVDVVGAAISVVLFASLVFGLIEGRTYGWWLSDTPPSFWKLSVSPIPFAFALTLISIVGYIAWGLYRQRIGKSTLINFSLFRIASFRNGNLAAMVVALGEFGLILSLPLWVQNVLGYSALQTGFVLLALALGSFAASGFAGAFSGRIAPVWVVRAGIALEIIGVVLTGLVISTGTPWWAIAIGLFVYGMGVGLATAQLTGVILADVPVEQSGAASGTQSTARQVGSALGIAILGTILFSTLGTQFADKLPASIPPAAQTQLVNAVVSSAGGAIPGLVKQSPEVGALAKQAFSDATKISAFSAAGFLALGLLATISLGSGKREEDESDA